MPNLFTQLFTISYFYNEKLLPAVFVLSKHRSVRTYEAALSALAVHSRLLQCEFKPKTIVCDFESSLHSALKSQLPDSRIQGCYFHFCQCLYRKLASLGLSSSFAKNDNFRVLVRVIMALAFLPSCEVEHSFTCLVAHFAKFDPNVDKLFKYMRKHWLHDVDTWNVYNARIRTNNDIEGWHSSVSKRIRKHPDIYQFLALLQDEEQMSRLLINQCDASQAVKRTNKRHAEISKKLSNLKFEYVKGRRTRLSFLKACSAAISGSIGRLRTSGHRCLDGFPPIPVNIFTAEAPAPTLALPPQSSVASTVEQAEPVAEIVYRSLTAAVQMQICAFLGLEVFSTMYSDFSFRSTSHVRKPPQQVQSVAGDGNCLFRALSVLFTGNQCQHLVIRDRVCNYIAGNYESVGADADYLALSGMRNDGIWGTDVELLAVARIIQCNVFVYSSVGSPDGTRRWLRFSPNFGGSGADSHFSVFLNHAAEMHYEPVLVL